MTAPTVALALDLVGADVLAAEIAADSLVVDRPAGRVEVPLAEAVPELVGLHAAGTAPPALRALAEAAWLAVAAVARERVRWADGRWRADGAGSPDVDAFVQAFVEGTAAADALVAAVTVDVDAAGTARLALHGSRRPDPSALAALLRAAAGWPALDRLLTVDGRVELDDDDLRALLDGGLDALRTAGVDVRFGPGVDRPRARPVLAPYDGPGAGPAAASLRWQLDVRGTALTPDELDALAAAHRPLVRLRGGWALHDDRAAPRGRASAAVAMTPGRTAAAVLSGVVEAVGREVPLAESPVAARVREALSAVPELPPPPRLAAALRDYQLHGMRWLARNADLGFGSCLADDMGLGKTITAIAFFLHREAGGPALVVCPASVLVSWEREILRFAPGTPVRRHHGPNRACPAAEAGFVLTTYATLRADAGAFAATRWGLVIADEAQNVKNPRTAAARALRAVPATARVALTGTPVENRLEDLWSILDWTTPGLLGTRAAFRRGYVRPIAAGDDAAAERLARLVAPFLLRRRKTDPGVAPELPAKTVTDIRVALTDEQAGLYQAVADEALAAVEAAPSEVERRGAVLRLLTGLKQVCNHPAQYLAEPRPRLPGRSGKLDALDEILDVALSDGASALVFTQYATMGRLLATHLRRRGVPAALLSGSTSLPQRQSIVDEFQRGQTQVLVLSLMAAGTGLTLTRAEHVVHYDRWWNPAVEEQATDRAYRIGQTRPVQVHRLTCEGTVEEGIADMLQDKRRLAQSVLDAGDEHALTGLDDASLRRLVALRA